MIETMDQAREAFANLNPAVPWGLLMSVPAMNYAQFLWQAAYREATQGEAVIDCTCATELDKEAFLASVTIHRDPLAGLPITPFEPDPNTDLN